MRALGDNQDLLDLIDKNLIGSISINRKGQKPKRKRKKPKKNPSRTEAENWHPRSALRARKLSAFWRKVFDLCESMVMWLLFSLSFFLKKNKPPLMLQLCSLAKLAKDNWTFFRKLKGAKCCKRLLFGQNIGVFLFGVWSFSNFFPW